MKPKDVETFEGKYHATKAGSSILSLSVPFTKREIFKNGEEVTLVLQEIDIDGNTIPCVILLKKKDVTRKGLNNILQEGEI